MLLPAAARIHEHSGVTCITIRGLLSPVKGFMASKCCRLLLWQLHDTMGMCVKRRGAIASCGVVTAGRSSFLLWIG